MAETDTDLREPVTLVLEQGVPVRLDWNGIRYYPDEPPVPRGIPLTRTDDAPLPTLVTRWRITASPVGGDAHVFDVISGSGARWRVTAAARR